MYYWSLWMCAYIHNSEGQVYTSSPDPFQIFRFWQRLWEVRINLQLSKYMYSNAAELPYTSLYTSTYLCWYIDVYTCSMFTAVQVTELQAHICDEYKEAMRSVLFCIKWETFSNVEHYLEHHHTKNILNHTTSNKNTNNITTAQQPTISDFRREVELSRTAKSA